MTVNSAEAMKPMRMPLLRTMPRELRLLAFFAMLTLSVGYAHAIGYVYLTTHIVPKGISERYRGTEQLPPAPQQPSTGIGSASDTPATSQPQTITATGDQQYQKSLAEMLNIIHTHVITMTLIFALSGVITACTDTISRRVRNLAIVEPFVGILLTFGGLWATRYLGSGWSWVVSASGALMALAFFVQLIAVMLEFRRPRV